MNQHLLQRGRAGGAAMTVSCRGGRLPARHGRSATPPGLIRYRTTADRGSVPPPDAVAGAEWQPGVTHGADRLRPTLDGEPVPGALAASVSEGWVRIAPLDALRFPKRGVVRLVSVSRVCR